MVGTIVNVGAVILGSAIGLAFRSRIPKRLFEIVFQAIGLFTICLGLVMAFKANNMLIMVFSLVTGSLMGEWINIEKGTERLSDKIKHKLGKGDDASFSTGMITAFLLFCMGSMSILGCFEEGMGKGSSLLFTKSIMDGFSAIALTAAFGIGVMFSSIPLFIYQASLTLLAILFGNIMPDAIIVELTGIGGILILGLGITILDIKKIRVLNMLPALLIEVVLCYFFL
ncbi:DUF554 domain-containing protein [Ancylomarina euxinus]|uniref:DUF554 domain-containing protein n=1 Tax=Ancylomarina euxinus TaxID=2283627 RepID=A0A425XXG7_9BACT|nr:DUF554 domain-containing protein [Ancylomarina euxinus]MCZ4696083.1 DUF554 domain-containing protein [Ancylomarina euxinus]MUP16492.1 DUF554 family protein [Ancylomarina euxinus]RRG19355.1 DUF554 domain-containing protein [Ancylomarina euxinus]